jgi:hypothetical protein
MRYVMKQFEYEITKHPAEEFNRVVYFCSAQGQCNYEALPSEQMTKLGELLNERGARGWELIQVSFGSDGVVAFWKRGKMDEDP